MHSYSIDKPEVEKYDEINYRVPFCVEQVTAGDGEDAVEQYRARSLLCSGHPSLSERRNAIAGALNKDVGAYVYGHYDAGTQQTFQALLAIDTVPDTVKAAIKSIFPWIQGCLGYYYAQKAEILASDTPEMVTWDFSQFDVSKPDVTLSSLLGGI